jgi:hypothetical protein
LQWIAQKVSRRGAQILLVVTPQAGIAAGLPFDERKRLSGFAQRRRVSQSPQSFMASREAQ